MYRPGLSDLNSCKVSPPPKYFRASTLLAMAASNAAVPSWKPALVKPMTALTKMVLAFAMTSVTRASLNDSADTSRKYPVVSPCFKSASRRARTIIPSPITPHFPATGTHPQPSNASLSITTPSGTSLRSTSGTSNCVRAMATSDSSTPLIFTPNFAAMYALYSWPPSITWSAFSAIALMHPILVSSLLPAMTARNGRTGVVSAERASTSFCMSKPAHEGSILATW